jgi:hypothetical protein
MRAFRYIIASPFIALAFVGSAMGRIAEIIIGEASTCDPYGDPWLEDAIKNAKAHHYNNPT